MDERTEEIVRRRLAVQGFTQEQVAQVLADWGIVQGILGELRWA